MRNASRPVTSRADEVRRRREQRASQKPAVLQKPRRASTPVKTAPVVMRGGYGMPVIRKAQSRTRRFYTLSTGTPGVDMITPAIPVIKPGWRLLSGFMVLLLMGLFIAALALPEFEVGAVEVYGVERLAAGDLQTASGVIGESIFAVDPRQVKASLEQAYPDLASIRVQVGLPAKITITVTERQPFFAWVMGDTTLWIDSDGYIFPARGEAGSLLTIIADGPPPARPLELELPPDQLHNKELLETARLKAEAEAAIHPRADLPILEAATILIGTVPSETALVYSPNDGLGWNDPRGWRVYIGASLRDLEQKMLVYQAIVEYLAGQGITPAMVSVAQLHAPYYRLN